MILLVSGEGPTDIGATQSQQCPTPTVEVAWGPMGMMINKLVEPIWWDNAPIDTGSMRFVSEFSLASYQNESKSANRKKLALPGLNRSQETAFFYQNARALARMAKTTSEKEKCRVGAVLFRDADRTRGARRTLREDKVRSIEDGFSSEQFDLGVPMVPKPKSEAWLLCALQEQPYKNCARLEGLSGNDNSPNPAKALLDEALGSHGQAGDLADFVSDGRVDVQRIEMPSFNEFRERMVEVAKAMLSGPDDPGQTRP